MVVLALELGERLLKLTKLDSFLALIFQQLLVVVLYRLTMPASTLSRIGGQA